jgi:hypothetical protein
MSPIMSVMLKQQSFKRGGRGRSQIVETRQGSKIDRREGGRWGAQGKIGNGSAGQKKGLFKNSVNVFILSRLPGISQIRTLFKVYGAELCLHRKRTILIIIIPCGSPARWL